MLILSCNHENNTVFLAEITLENVVVKSVNTGKVVHDLDDELPGLNFSLISDATNIQDILAILESFNPAYLWAHVSGKL